MPFISNGIRDKLLKSINYNTKQGAVARGIPANLLPEICQIWLSAREKGALTQTTFSTQVPVCALKQNAGNVAEYHA